MQISVIYDNLSSGKEGLQEGHGFSAYIENGCKKIIFDTGGSVEAFFNNIAVLNISLHNVSHVVFSHEHWDHRAGLKEVFTQLPQKTTVFVPKAFPKKLLKMCL